MRHSVRSEVIRAIKRVVTRSFQGEMQVIGSAALLPSDDSSINDVDVCVNGDAVADTAERADAFVAELRKELRLIEADGEALSIEAETPIFVPPSAKYGFKAAWDVKVTCVSAEAKESHTGITISAREVSSERFARDVDEYAFAKAVLRHGRLGPDACWYLRRYLGNAGAYAILGISSHANGGWSCPPVADRDVDSHAEHVAALLDELTRQSRQMNVWKETASDVMETVKAMVQAVRHAFTSLGVARAPGVAPLPPLRNRR